MSKLNELIASTTLSNRANRSSSVVEMINEFCPNGVEYKTLGEIGR